MFFLVSCQDEFVIGPNSCLHAVIDIIDPVKQVHLTGMANYVIDSNCEQ